MTPDSNEKKNKLGIDDMNFQIDQSLYVCMSKSKLITTEINTELNISMESNF